MTQKKNMQEIEIYNEAPKKPNSYVHTYFYDSECGINWMNVAFTIVFFTIVGFIIKGLI